MKRSRMKVLAALGLAVMMAAVMTGCANSNNTAKSEEQNQTSTVAESITTSVAGTILLSVNPEIDIDYDNNGKVLEIEARNEDAKALLAALENYEGQDCKEAVANLVDAIYAAGYFDETLDGKTRNIVVKLNAGSAYPSEDFLEEIADSVRITVEANEFDSSTLTVTENDLDEKGYIGVEKAKELVLAHLRVTDAAFNDHEYELDDGVYEFELTVNGVEYDYEVDAVTGKILEADADNNDWNDKDDWNEWNEVTNTSTKKETANNESNGTVTNNKTNAIINNEPIGVEKAKEIALADLGVKEAAFIEVDTDLDDNEYDLDIYVDDKEYSYEINAYTGKIVDKDVEKMDAEDKAEAQAKKAASETKTSSTAATSTTTTKTENTSTAKEKIGMEKAKAIALADLGNSNAKLVDSEYDDGKYELEFYADGVEYSYEINAYTGKIIDKEVEADDDTD